MTDFIKTAGVLGSGVMGSAIAAHLSGAGIRVHLLDIVPPNLGAPENTVLAARNKFAQSSLEKTLKAKPAAFYDPDSLQLITVGNLDDHLERLKECDLVIEAVLEKMDVKQSLFKKILPHLTPNVVLASNTSGLSIKEMTKDLPAWLQKRFLVMHFFNPVRYMRLLEIVPGPATDSALVERMSRFGEMLGKGIVRGKDTTNFVANRIGVYGMMQSIRVMEEEGLTVEEIDKIAGKPMGRPASAIFRTGDMVGIDTLLHVAKNCYDVLIQDEEREVFKAPQWINDMVAKGLTGQKSGGGFYKKQNSDILVIDPQTLNYREQKKVRFDSLGQVKGIDDLSERIKTLVGATDKAGIFAWKSLSRTLCYAARRVGEIADDIVNIDRAMRWGFNWDLGPFEVWDAIGVKESVDRMKTDGLQVPEWVSQMLTSGRKTFYDGLEAERNFFDPAKKKATKIPIDPHLISLKALHQDPKRIVKENLGASLVDLGDGCLCFEVHTKMNTIDGDVTTLLKEAVDEAEKNFDALVIGNDGEHFGAGANLMLVFMAAQQKDWAQIDLMVRELQGVLQRARYSRVPVVAAPFGYTFGGACEMSMAADALQAYAETYIGLVEVGAGVIPAGGGCLRCVERWTGPVAGVPGVDLLPLIGQAALNIGTAAVGAGAEDGKRLKYVRATDGVTLNRDHLLYHAKQRALGMAKAGYLPPRPPILKAAGLDAAKTIQVKVWGMVEGGQASQHDALILKKLSHILCGGNVAAQTTLVEQDYLDLEREAFLSLCGEEKTQARIQALLMSGKPLRN